MAVIVLQGYGTLHSEHTSLAVRVVQDIGWCSLRIRFTAFLFFFITYPKRVVPKEKFRKGGGFQF